MLVAQLSDLHLLSSNKLKSGVDTTTNTKRLVKAISRHKPDLVMLSGDIADDGSRMAYADLATILDSYGLNIQVLPGNHDDLANLQLEFPNCIRGKECFGAFSMGEFRSIILDTSSNAITNNQLEWLRSLEKYPTLIWMHHPPTTMNSFFLDRITPLKNHKELWQVLTGRGDIHHVFCGHYHHGYSLKKKGINIHICPSGYKQVPSKWFHPRMDFKIGYRLIQLNEQAVDTQVYYLPGGHLGGPTLRYFKKILKGK
jgi:Icc protein